MRILAIRGRNLASLAEPFEIDFRAEPLASAGLFAIAGPTGSGKSTLLDALCLALYDSTPRLRRAGTRGELPDADGTIKPQDPRTLLRRGSAEGRAEVEFAGNDGHDYRATWTVRRAHGRANGRLQATEMRLVRLPGEQPIGSLKTEVLEAIRQRIGLSFEQFTRAVLLAQNEFAAFLKADEDERALLLQTLTGSDLYEAISRRAFERAKAEQQALAQLQREREAQQPLDEAARGKLEQERNAANQAVAALDRRKAELDGHARWHRERLNLDQARNAAASAHGSAVAAEVAAAGQRDLLTQVEAVQAARMPVAELDRCGAELAQAEGGLRTATEAFEQAKAGQAQAEQRLAAARDGLTAAQSALAAAAPGIEEAAALDAAIAAIAPSHRQAQAQRDAEAKAQAEAETALALKASERQRTAAQQAAANAWLGAHAPLRELGEHWPRWDALLAQATGAARALTEAAGGVDSATRQESAAARRLESANRDAAQAAQQAALAEETLTAAAAALSGIDTEELAQRRREQEARNAALAEADRDWSALSDALRRKAEQVAAAQEQANLLAAAEPAVKRLEGERAANRAALEQARRSLEIAQRASGQGVEALRATLADGEPCPVCGAVEHPYATDDPKFAAALTALRAEAARIEQEATRLAQDEAREKNRAEMAVAGLASARAELDRLAPLIDGATVTWDAQPVAAEAADMPPEARAGWFAQALAATRARLAGIGNEEAAHREKVSQRDAAQTAAEAKRAALAQSRQTLEQARGAAEQAKAVLQLKRQQQDRASQALGALLAEIDPAFGVQLWREDWEADPAAFHEARHDSATQWIAQRDALAEATARIAVLDGEIKGLQAQSAAARQRLEAARRHFEQIDRDLQARRVQRKALFEGRPVAEVRAVLDQAIASAAKAVEERAAEAKAAGEAFARATEAREQTNRRASDARTAQGAAASAVDAWIAAFNAAHPAPQALDQEGLRRLLAHDAEWMAQTRRQIDALRQAVQQAKAVLDERSGRLTAHDAARPTPDSLESVDAALATLTSARTAAAAQATELELGLRADDERRGATARLAEAIAAQEVRTRLWSQLGDLVGSADGRKFRNAAQQVTLDVLLGFANRHLKDLARRYRLQRIENTLSLLVVDQDMADEVRSVHSLSGGESFLVSLALALALASLSSQRVRVESLFIDEGFGSLDTDTLRVAMDALDALQSLGRKVGVISHVPEMSERIVTQIQVRRLAGCRSEVVVTGP
jgi:exonuclease SbcC